MSIYPRPLDHFYEETARVARAVYLQGDLMMCFRDVLGCMYLCGGEVHE